MCIGSETCMRRRMSDFLDGTATLGAVKIDIPDVDMIRSRALSV
ncbi:MAG: hypothetical protein JWM99_672 [Verrucomicrobiales bacterium]|nr:hypothetical protein [Verrucomicrobiales bacterium]